MKNNKISTLYLTILIITFISLILLSAYYTLFTKNNPNAGIDYYFKTVSIIINSALLFITALTGLTIYETFLRQKQSDDKKQIEATFYNYYSDFIHSMNNYSALYTYPTGSQSILVQGREQFTRRFNESIALYYQDSSGHNFMIYSLVRVIDYLNSLKEDQSSKFVLILKNSLSDTEKELFIDKADIKQKQVIKQFFEDTSND